MVSIRHPIVLIAALALMIAVALALLTAAGPSKARADTFIPVPCGTPGAVGCVGGPAPSHAPLQP